MIKKEISELTLDPNERTALEKLKSGLEKKFPGSEIVLYGSRARGEGDKFSDLDILIIIDSSVNRDMRETITAITYPLELEYDVVFGKIIENRSDWDSQRSRSTPLHLNIDREGVRI